MSPELILLKFIWNWKINNYMSPELTLLNNYMSSELLNVIIYNNSNHFPF